jgi:hypothetical protein
MMIGFFQTSRTLFKEIILENEGAVLFFFKRDKTAIFNISSFTVTVFINITLL